MKLRISKTSLARELIDMQHKLFGMMHVGLRCILEGTKSSNGNNGHLVSLLSFLGGSLYVCWLAVIQKGKEHVTYVDTHMLPTITVREASDWLCPLNMDIQHSLHGEVCPAVSS